MAEKQSGLLEDYGARPVPPQKSRNWFQLGIVYWGMAVCLPAFLVAGLVAGPSRLSAAIWSFVLGAFILSIIAVLTGMLGAGTRISTGLSARFTFGKYGANLVQLALFFGLWGWFGVQLGFMAAGLGEGGLAFAISRMSGGTVNIPVWVLEVVGGGLMTLTAMIGFKAIEKLSIAVIPLLLVILLATIISIYRGGKTLASVANVTGEGAMPLGAAISFVISTYIIGALVTPDVTRYAKSKSSGGWGMFFGMMVGFPIILILGGIMVKGALEADFSKVMLMNNVGFWGVLAILTIVFAAWTTNDNNLYSGALAINAIFPGLKKWMITVLAGAAGTVLALLGINTSAGFTSFLSFLAVTIPPAASVMIIDYYLYREEGGYDPERIEQVANFKILPFLSWILAAAFGLLVNYTPLRFTGIVAIDTIIVGAVLYLVLMSVTGKRMKLQV